MTTLAIMDTPMDARNSAGTTVCCTERGQGRGVEGREGEKEAGREGGREEGQEEGKEEVSLLHIRC